MVTIKCNEFVKRQTAESQFSHFIGTWEELEKLAVHQFLEGTQGYKDGVMLVPVNPAKFFCGVVKLEAGTELAAEFAPRREGEESFINITARGSKTKANRADLVIYRKDVLAEGKENTTDADWEIVSINARVGSAPDPMDPVTMMRNFLALPGGTKGDFTAEQFAESIRFWSQHALVSPSK